MDGSELTALFEYDDEQTAENVSEFFKNFKRISRMAGEDPAALKSPMISGIPVSHDAETIMKIDWSNTLMPPTLHRR